MQTDKGETLVYPEIQSIDGRSIIETMTVHKAKGLEFDSVIIPNTNMDFFYENPKVGRKDCIVDCGPDGSFRLGWRLGRYMNDQYEKQRDDESMAIRRDEARLLYVAMTRARGDCLSLCLNVPSEIHGLNCWILARELLDG